MHSPSCGKISLTSMPLCPYFLNVNGDFSRLPVLRSVCRLPEGIGLPLYFVEHRLGIERVHLRRSAVQEQIDDALGLGRKMRRLGRQRVGVACAARQAARTRPCRNPAPIVCSRSLRSHLSSPTRIRWSSAGRGRIRSNCSSPGTPAPAAVLPRRALCRYRIR